MCSLRYHILSLLLFVFITESRSSLICDNLIESSKNDTSPNCLNQLDILCNNGTLLWQMFDASSKYPLTGMSFTNNRDFGNFDECISLSHSSPEGDIKGKYCGISVAIVNLLLPSVPNPFALKIQPRSLAHYTAINYTNSQEVQARDGDNDFTVSLLSLCIPDQCTPREVGKFFIWGQLEGIQLVNFVDRVPCLTSDSNTSFTGADIAFTTVLVIIFFLTVSSTCYDYVLQKLDREAPHTILLSFSVLTNLRKILHISHSKNPDQIQCLNGLRSISMMWVIAGHGFVATEEVPLINYAEISDYLDKIQTEYILSSPISVDTFFFISGLLLAFGYLKTTAKYKLERHLLGIPTMIVQRYLRLTPAVAMLYLSMITIFHLIGSGPLWGAVTDQLKTTCTKYAVPFFFYFQNYYNFDDMCLSHTWYLSADMQMFLLAPLVLIPIALLKQRKKDKLVLVGLIIFVVVMVIVPMIPRFVDHTIANVYDTHSRIHIYLAGVLLAVILRDSKLQRFPFSKLANLAIWCTLLGACVLWNLYYHNVIRVYEHTKDTLFYGLYRPLWSLFLMWIVYSCYHGHGGVINWILTLPAFQIMARLSYCMYLIHAIVEMYWVGLSRTPFYWGDYTIFYNWCGHFIVTMILSFVWTLAFESPMIGITKYLVGLIQNLVDLISGGKKRPPSKMQSNA